MRISSADNPIEHVFSESSPNVDESMFRILHTLRIKGLANDAAVSTATGLPLDAVVQTINDLESRGLASRRSGKLTGVTLTARGHTTHVAMLAARTASPATAGHTYVRFAEINTEFKHLCTTWQVRPDGQLNDHSEERYDRAILARLLDLHKRAIAIVAELATQDARLARYITRLEAALDRVRAGDVTALVHPLSDSYHDIWMELHHDLRMTLVSSTSDGSLRLSGHQ
jgi:hypothetical protein